MREFKFRAYFRMDGNTYAVLAIDFSKDVATLYDAKTEADFKASFEDIELMQYTGHTDKNGVRIYEGDVLIKIDDICGGLYTVVYKNGYFYLSDSGMKYPFFMVGQSVYDAYYEVIGNIYENEYNAFCRSVERLGEKK
ncbi:YopX family protein [Campylobacter fetus]|uniref:YopX family protein n=1 Tax=Campylobacter fetus TaxID=196 RepID=UPI00138DE3CD|nr:YopX family protein [Campylobacter fetus]